MLEAQNYEVKQISNNANNKLEQHEPWREEVGKENEQKISRVRDFFNFNRLKISPSES